METRIHTSEPMQADKPRMTAWQRERMGPLEAAPHTGRREGFWTCVAVFLFVVFIAGMAA